MRATEREARYPVRVASFKFADGVPQSQFLYKPTFNNHFRHFFIAEELLTKYHIKYYSHQPLQLAETLTPPPFIGETIN